MEYLFRTFLILAAVLAGTSAAFAETVNLRLVNVGPGYNDGSYYVYPYNFSINGSSTLTSLLCDDFNHDIYFNETWTATVNSMHDILQGAGQMNPYGGLATNGDRNRAYVEAAWLFTQLSANPTSANAVSINHTIWGLFTATPFNSNSDVLSWFNLAAAATENLTVSQAETMFGNLVFYTPINGSQVPFASGLPQEMIGIGAQVPEPASLLLVGSGIVGIAVLRRKKLRPSPTGAETL